jgi:hypothetical protein
MSVLSTSRGRGGKVAPRKRAWRTPAEVAAEADVTERTVRRWCELGIVVARQTSTGRWRIYRSRKELEKANAAAGVAAALSVLLVVG